MVRKQIDDNWYLGEHHGFVGLFPKSFVQFLTPHLEAKYDLIQLKNILLSLEGLGRAKHNFSAQTIDELELRKGDLVSIVRKIDSNWCEGYIGTREGIFPIKYVDTIREPLEIDKLDMFKENFKYHQNTVKHNNNNNNNNNNINQHRLSDFVSTTKPELYEAKFNFEPEKLDEIELKKGDLILVYKICDDGWSIGLSTRTGQFGSFPFNYIRKH
jgi:hypothetical protein